MELIMALAFCATAIQGIMCRCDLLGILGAVCFLSSLLLAFYPYIARWAKIMGSVFIIVFLALIIYYAGWLDQLYLGNISEYRFVAIEAALALILNAFAFIPVKKKDVLQKKVVKKTK